MISFDRQTPDTVRAALDLPSNRKDYFVSFDSIAELADNARDMMGPGYLGKRAHEWNGHVSTDRALDLLRNGDLSAVAASDALLEKFEQYSPSTSRRAWTDGVCGAIPNVPAFVAGQPLNMRRRIRSESEFSPLAIVVDLTTSASITADQIRARGIAILALVRALSAVRPIELWACVMLDADSRTNCSTVAFRIETAPLDLARAAHILTHASVPRRLLYGIAEKAHRFAGGWPYDKKASHRPHMAAIIAPAFSHVTETLCVPSLLNADESVTNPVAWIEAQLAQATVASLPDAA